MGHRHCFKYFDMSTESCIKNITKYYKIFHICLKLPTETETQRHWYNIAVDRLHGCHPTCKGKKILLNIKIERMKSTGEIYVYIMI